MATTPNKSLPLYDAAVPPDLIGTYNKAMGILDAETSGGGGEGEWTDAVITREIDFIDGTMLADSSTKFKIIQCNMLVIVQFLNNTYRKTYTVYISEGRPRPREVYNTPEHPTREGGTIHIDYMGRVRLYTHGAIPDKQDLSCIQMFYLTDEEVS